MLRVRLFFRALVMGLTVCLVCFVAVRLSPAVSGPRCPNRADWGWGPTSGIVMPSLRQLWEDRKERKRAPPLAVAAPVTSSIREAARAANQDLRDAVMPGDLARELLAMMQSDGFDCFWTLAEINEYILELAKTKQGAEFAAELALGEHPDWNFATIREAFGGLPGVSLGQTRYLKASQFRSLRQRLRRRYGQDHRERPYSGAFHPVTGAPVVREKLWIYCVALQWDSRTTFRRPRPLVRC